jgi:cytochrome c-type biogenesis protein CcmF
MNYIGEYLLPGQLGHFFVVLSFVASLLATFAYIKSTRSSLENETAGWKKFARIAFLVQCVSVFTAFALVYYIISHHRFEYNYAWSHSSKSLSREYLLSCIWEGQEGAFLLWSLWHCVLGLVLIRTAGKWESPVMTVISFAQLCLATMVIGLYFGNHKIGINPFLLVRQIFQDAPIFNTENYLSLKQMQDGQGLNQLLQNYWMVIHPPVLFLGFASTIVPFAYSIAGLWKKDYLGWTKAAQPWTLFSAGILGLGIMMGAAWAYESLSFGGFWAWDPVENASLVPWLIMVAGLHTQLVYNATGHSLRATHLFLILSFVFVLFSTFLTRSGVLGDSSVHAFVESGINLQLLIFVLIFFVPALTLFFLRYKKIPFIVKEESNYSREFWMFIGSLVLFLSAMVINWQTAFTPIYNKITGQTTAAPEDPEFSYNKVQVFVAVVIGILTAVTQFLKYKDTPKRFFWKKMLLPLGASVAVAVLISLFGNIDFYKHGAGFLAAIHLAVFAAVYTVLANLSYIWLGLKGKLKVAGASVAHIGFGMMLLGIIISSAKKDVLSKNNGILLPFDPKSKEKPTENVTLLKGIKTDMGNYWATYEQSDSSNKFKTITYFKVNIASKKTGETFTLYPNLIKNTKGQENYSANPDARHYWNKDIFAYISYASNMDREEDTAQFRKYTIKLNDTVYYSNGYMILNKVGINPPDSKHALAGSDTLIVAALTVAAQNKSVYKAQPAIYWKGTDSRFIFDTLFAQNLAVGFTGVDYKKGTFEIQVKESVKMVPFVSLKVYEFPQINLLWLGTVVMVIGFFMSMLYRIRLYRAKK